MYLLQSYNKWRLILFDINLIFKIKSYIDVELIKNKLDSSFYKNRVHALFVLKPKLIGIWIII